MSLATPCQTSGAVFHTSTTDAGITASVDYGRLIPLTEAESVVLEANIHNALELVLAPLFRLPLGMWEEHGGLALAPGYPLPTGWERVHSLDGGSWRVARIDR